MTKIKGTLEEQLKLEEESKLNAEEMLKKSYDDACRNGRAGETQIGSSLLSYSLDTCKNNVRKLLMHKKRGVVPEYQSVIDSLKKIYDNDEKLIQTCTQLTLSILVSETIREGTTILNSLSNLATVLGGTLKKEAEAEEYVKNTDKGNAKYFDVGLSKRVGTYYKEQYATKAFALKKFVPTVLEDDRMTKLAVKLIEMCVSGSGYFAVGYAEHKNKKGKIERIKAIHAKQWLIDTWNKNIKLLAFNKYRYAPCVIPPKSWSSVWNGGYYGVNAKFTQFIRQDFYRKNIFLTNYLEKLEQLDMSWLFNVVNHLQETPFVINEKVLNVCLDIMSNHGSLGGLPSTDDLPELPRLINPTSEELKKHKVKLTAMYKKDRARQSKLLRTNCTLAVAKKYSQYEKVYFPWNMDYRGRLYPMPTEINPQGDDLQKALLLFAEPEPLTDNECLKWFYIAGAGFAGLDKKHLQSV